jgi:predicted acylesterase/phospholipase RssA
MNKKIIKLSQLIVLLSTVSACSTLPVRTLSQSEVEEKFDSYAATYQKELLRSQEKSRLRIYKEYSEGEEQSYDILVLSGGGPLGAFGAGFLLGWGEIQEEAQKRPMFDSVSGVSTGALIAPFAFVGTDEAYSEIVGLYSNPDDNLIVARDIFSFLTGSNAYYDTSGLHKRIQQSITPNIVKGLAEGANEHRVLLVGATNLDYGLMRVWDLAEFAKTEAYDEAHKQITEKLIASSAIPSAFSPIEIDDYLYVDGGASMQVVAGIADRKWLYDSNAKNIDFISPTKPIKIRVWVIVNNKLMIEPEVTKKTWSEIAQRSLITLMRGSTLQTLQDLETFTQMINKLNTFDVQMRYVAIPEEFEIPETERMFDKDKMVPLVQLGREMGRNPHSWKRKALRPGAPFVSDQKE